MSSKGSIKKLAKSRNAKTESKEAPESSAPAAPIPVPTTSNRSFAEEVDLFLALKDEDLAGVSEEKVLEMRKSLNPYGRTIAGSDKYLNFSITQVSHEYWKKFITTAFVGYLNRMCDEWKVPSGVPVVSVYDYLDDPTKLDTPEAVLKKGDKGIIYDHEFNRKWMEKRLIVKEFLEEMFQFNPDEHVRSAYKPNFGDKSRTPLQTMAARVATQHLAKTDPKFRAELALNNQVNEVVTKKKVRKVIKGRDGKVRELISEVDVPNAVTPPAPTNPKPLNPEHPADPNVTSTVTNMIPPHDMFGRFKMYYTENLEQLRDATLNLYCEKPDLELAINPYAVHDDKDAAEAFKKQHANEVIAEIFTAHTGKWNFFDSFKEQRESVNFYNKNTAVLEEMVKQTEKDERLGKDLMEKRVQKEKKKNVIESGPDAENFKKWREENSDIQKLGAKHIGGMADEDCPDDAIQVDVWRVAKGGLEITKDKFYSQSEAPTFVKEAQDKAAAGIDPFASAAPPST
jgi:hypothetical protein